MEQLLNVKDLRVNFHTYAGVVKAVRGVSFSLARGEVLAIVGESGCGKTVTAKAVMRLLGRTSGKIQPGSVVEMEGRNLADLSLRELNRMRGKEISMIFQDSMTSLNPTMTVGKQIMENILTHEKMTKSQARQRARELLELVEIPDPEGRLDNYPHQMSGGMRQRAMIAIALACNPKILIADEPIAALDVSIQAQVVNLLIRLQRELGLTYLFISHDLSMVRHISDRIAVMYLGSIVEMADTPGLYERPMHPYSRALLSAIPKADPDVDWAGKRIPLTGEVPNPINAPAGCKFWKRCPMAKECCQQTPPPLREMAPGHFVACHRAEELAET